MSRLVAEMYPPNHSSTNRWSMTITNGCSQVDSYVELSTSRHECVPSVTDRMFALRTLGYRIAVSPKNNRNAQWRWRETDHGADTRECLMATVTVVRIDAP